MSVKTFKKYFRIFQIHKSYYFISLFGISITLMMLTTLYSFLESTIGNTRPETNANRILEIKKIYLTGKGGKSISALSHYFINRYVTSLNSAEKVSVYSSPEEISLYIENQKIRRSINNL